MWKRRSRPACSFMRTKVGLLTTLVTPRPSATPLASSVLPAPSGPMRASSVPGVRVRAERAPDRPASPAARRLRDAPGSSIDRRIREPPLSGLRAGSPRCWPAAPGRGGRPRNGPAPCASESPIGAACRSSSIPPAPRPGPGTAADGRSPGPQPWRARDASGSGAASYTYSRPSAPKRLATRPACARNQAKSCGSIPTLPKPSTSRIPNEPVMPARLAPPALDRLEVAQLLVEHAAQHDPGHAHRPRAGQRLGRGSRSADQDLAGGAGVDRRGAQLVAGIRHADHQLAVHRLAAAAHAVQPGRRAPRSRATPPRPRGTRPRTWPITVSSAASGREQQRPVAPEARRARRPATGAQHRAAPSTSASGCSASTRSPGRDHQQLLDLARLPVQRAASPARGPAPSRRGAGRSPRRA